MRVHSLLVLAVLPLVFLCHPLPAQSGEANPTTSTLTLEQLIGLAKGHDPALAEAAAELEAARGEAQQAGLFPNPRLRYNMSNLNPDVGVGSEDHSVRLMQNVAIGGRLSKGRAVGEAKRKYYEQRIEQRQYELEGEVRAARALAAYYWQASQNLAAWQLELERARKDADQHFQELNAPLIDVSRIEWEMQSVRQDQEKLAGEARCQLAQLAGLAALPRLECSQLADPPALSTATLSMEPSELDRRKAWLVQQHPAIGAAQVLVEIAQRELDLAKAERIPDVEVGGGAGHSRMTDEDELQFLVEMDLPIFDRKQGKIKACQAEMDKARAEMETVRRELAADFDENRARLEQAVAQRQFLLQTALVQNESSCRKMQERFQDGQCNLGDLFDAQRMLLRSRIDLLKACGDELDARQQILRLTGATLPE